MAVQRMLTEDFDKFVLLPENANRLFELIHGEIVERVSSGYSSMIGALIAAESVTWARKTKSGRVTGAKGGYVINDDRYIPTAAYVSKANQPTPSHEAYNPLPPDLAVEVLSPGNNPTDIRTKIFNYTQAGTVVWLVDPEAKQVEVYAPGQPTAILGVEDTLNGGSVLPGFTLAVKAIFED